MVVDVVVVEVVESFNRQVLSTGTGRDKQKVRVNQKNGKVKIE